jgi:hypothetical protein
MTDHGPATTVAMIDDLADRLRQTDKDMYAIIKRLTPEQAARFEALTPALDAYSASIDLKKWADEWQTEIDNAPAESAA